MFFIISVPTTNYKNAQKVCIPLKSCAAINKEKAPRSDAPGGFGPSGATRTRGFHIPNVAPYQLGYTRIFNFYHYTTAEGKIKDFSVCGHSCGQIRFCAVFGNRGESRKRRCRKALRRFASPYPGYRHGTPKAGALPAALHPDMYFSVRQHAFAHILRTFKKVAALPAAPVFRDRAQQPRALSDCTGGKPVHFAICVR